MTHLLVRARLAARGHRGLGTGGGRARSASSASTVACSRSDGDVRLSGLVLPGLANVHSHAFHRALRGRTHDRRRLVLDLARADVRGRRPARPGLLPAAGAGRLRRDVAGRDHRRRGVPLPAPRTGRCALRRPERDGDGAGPGRRGGRGAADAAGHLLPRRRPRTRTATCRWTRCRSASRDGSRRGLAAAGRAARCGSGDEWDHGRVGPAVHSVRAVPGRPAGRGRRGRRPARRCTSTCPSSRRRTRRAWRRTASPRPAAGRQRPARARPPPPCTRST